MDNLARKPLQDAIYQEYATVVAAKNNLFLVHTAEGAYHARRAVSCLLKPHVGDRVLICAGPPDECYILSILEHDAAVANHLEFEGEVNLRVNKGRFKLNCQEGIDIASAGDIRTMSETVNVNAVKGKISIHDLFFQGGFLLAHISGLKWVADTVDAMVERVTQRFKRHYRTVDEFEQVKAGRVDYLVKKLLSFRSQYTIMSSKEDVKVDGERIHIG